MNKGSILLRPVKELLGMNFFIPDYQRGYRWNGQQAKDLLSDIESFAEKIKNDPDSPEIYCIQPLVTQRKSEDILTKVKQAESIAEVEKYIKGSWDVVDGQQRLTTIFLILKNLGIRSEELYSIDYQTRDKSKDYLKHISDTLKMDNIDFYHIYEVDQTIKKWFMDNPELQRENYNEVILNRVYFIWYQLPDTENAVSVFTRLNIGKIPLTDSELIKALFLNRSNFKTLSRELESEQRKIAAEWDEIENTLQNDEFWLFIHGKEYGKPTRIDFILDYICEKNLRGRWKEARELRNKIGNDEHRTFRYFYEKFSIFKKEENIDELQRLKELWKEITDCYRTFNEWYHDYRLFHYIGYLTTVDINIGMDRLLEEYSAPNAQKESFVKFIKGKIKEYFKKCVWYKELDNYKFDQEGARPKTECAPLLLLHNIETVIQQNEKLATDKKYRLPNFTKFPFHLYKSENWQVEHIHPSAGDDKSNKDHNKIYLMLAKEFLPGENELCREIEKYIKSEDADDPGKSDGTDDGFVKLAEKINNIGGTLREENKNTIRNFTLLDETTNKEYQNAIFPVKRAFIANKERGFKVTYKFVRGNKLEEKKSPEIAFIPPCTKNVFLKSYTAVPRSLISWTEEDAQAYLDDMKKKLEYYLSEND